MIDLFTLALTHGLMAMAAIVLLGRDDLDMEAGAKRPRRWQRQRPGHAETAGD